MSVSAQPEATGDSGHVETMFVHFDELDPLGMLHNSRYAVLVERALMLFWDQRGYVFGAGARSHPDAAVAVMEMFVAFRRPIVGTGPVHVHIWVERTGTSSVTYGFRVRSVDGATVHAEGHRVHVRVDMATLRPTAWGEETLGHFESLRLDAPAAG